MTMFRPLTFIMTCLLSLQLHAASIEGPAPDFTLKSHSGENLKLSEMRGNVIMINFWASWCGPCRQEMPILEQIYQKYQPLGFTLLGVNVEEDPNAAKTFLKDVKVSFPILFDNTNEVSQLYQIIAMPSTARGGRAVAEPMSCTLMSHRLTDTNRVWL